MMEKVLKSVAEAFLSANELLGSVSAHKFTAERTNGGKYEEELKVKPKIMTGERNMSRKTLTILTSEHAELRQSANAAKQSVDAQMRETREDQTHKLDALHNAIKARRRKLLQKLDKKLVKLEL